MNKKLFKSDIVSNAIGIMKTFLLSDEGYTALDKFIETQYDRLEEKGLVYRAYNLIIMLGLLSEHDLLPIEYKYAPWVLWLKCDLREWIRFENQYFEYYIQASSLLK